MAHRVVEIYERNYNASPPAAYSDADEIIKLKNLIDGHFGVHSISSRAASLGVFVHHGCTPHGVRLSIEHAMQKGKINFVACTSTLAQGVNLPIRYLIVSGIYQGRDKLKVRDFQNLIGRAGRSGMHTEGLIIFSDPSIYDKRSQLKEKWRFNSSVELLNSDKAEDTASSLLGILSPFMSSDQKYYISMPAQDLYEFLFSDMGAWNDWANAVVKENPRSNFKVKDLISEIGYRRRLIHAIESHLMANRRDETYESFKSSAEELAESTLAYHLASDELKPSIKALFGRVAEYLHNQEPILEKQSLYSKTLLGIKGAKDIEQWVNENKAYLRNLKSNENWINAVWNLFSSQLDDKFFHLVEPQDVPIGIVKKWISGDSYKDIFSYVKKENATKPWGDTQRRLLTEDEIIDFCESTVGFECSLILAAVANFLFDKVDLNSEDSFLSHFQKSLKYGLPDTLTVSCYDMGFSDRVLAQTLCNSIKGEGFSGGYFSSAVEPHKESIKSILEGYPSYFENVFIALG